MRIEGIETIPIKIPLTRDFGGSTYHVPSRCTIITRIRTDVGLVSEVYNGDNREQALDIVKIIQEELAPLIIGEEVHDIEKLWEKMYAITKMNRDRKLAIEAIACVDTALWDLVGKASGISVSKMLGGYRTSLPIITIAGYYEEGKTLNDLAREMAGLKAMGLAGCKMKVGQLSPERDAERVAAARDGAGKDFMLAVDANRGWSVADAIRFSHLIEHLDIEWFEEPCHWYDDAYMMARVRQATCIPINAGQSEFTSHGVRRLIEAGAVDYVNFDASESGGITEWRRVAGMCSVFGVKMAHHEEPQIAMQMLAGVPHGTYLECFANPDRDPIWQGLIANRPQIRDGRIEILQGPGFGLVLDEKMIRKYRVK
ncbi:MAG: mandelate racemase/muconate lactonizing enzyme family protein [Deltaproteobacteria bacterium]|nr:mandelate racemase/muconate lactonizing enzyme family protein [Deltaproteobacteria bacterium]